VLKHLAPSLPAVQLKSDDGSRSVFVYPNPENPDRYIVLWQSKLLSLGSEVFRIPWIMPLCLLPDHVCLKDGKSSPMDISIAIGSSFRSAAGWDCASLAPSYGFPAFVQF
jgi:hypothetical protein